MSDETPTDSVEALARRLERVEKFLAAQWGYVDRDAPPRVQPPPMPAASYRAVPRPPDDAATPLPIAVAAPIEASTEPRARDERVALPVGLAIARPPAMPTSVANSPRHGGLEQLVGLKLAGWVGAIVLVIGAALGVKYAYDQGWLGNVPDGVRLGLLYATGFAIVGLGEFIYRRVGKLASVGVFGAGIAILFVVGYAGDAYFNLYGQRAAFALMAGAAAIGAIVSWRAQLASIAVLSLIGANLAPALLGHSAAGETTLLVYLLTLQLLALGLAHVGDGDRWWSLRGVSLATTAFWVCVRLADNATFDSRATVGFTIAYAAIYQLEAALAARRAPMTWPQRLGSFGGFSSTVTAMLMLAVLAWTEPWTHGSKATLFVGLAMLAITAGAAGLAATTRRPRAAPDDAAGAGEEPGRREYALPRRLGAREISDVPFRDLSVAWIGQGLAILVLAVPVAFDGPAVLVGWLVLSLLYATMGVVGRRPGTSVAGVIVWAIAVLDFSVDKWSTHELFHVGAVGISEALVLGLSIAAVGHGIAMLLGSPRLSGPTSGWIGRLAWPMRLALPVAATLLALDVAGWSLPPLVATIAFAAIAWTTLAISRVDRRCDVAWLAVIVSAFAVGKWLVNDVLGTRFGNEPMTQTPIVNATIAVGVGVALSGVALTWLSERSRRPAGEPRTAQIERLIAVGVAIGAIALGLCVDFQPAARQFATGSAWPAEQIALLAQTALATLVFLALPPLQRAIAPLAVDAGRFGRACGWAIVALAAKFVALDSLAFAFDDAVFEVRPVANAQAAVAAWVIVAAALVAWRDRDAIVGAAAAGCVAIVPLVAGSIELARAVGPGRTLVALSVFWAAYASVAIAVGFAIRRGAWLRIGGLALLAITIAKVVFFDLASAGTGWRILSFLAVGALLLATSVLYGKFGAQLLGRDERDAAPGGFEVEPKEAT